MSIESNSATAGDIATGITHSAAGILAVETARKDGTSSYHGNTDAHSHIGYEQDYSSQASGKLNDFVTLVQSMAAEFEAVDASISQSISGTTSSGAVALPRSGRSLLLTD
ncbi:TIGR04197 family type VII secretion effector [Streptococcus pluranimalium]